MIEVFFLSVSDITIIGRSRKIRVLPTGVRPSDYWFGYSATKTRSSGSAKHLPGRDLNLDEWHMYIVSDRRRNLKYIIKSVLPFNKDCNESRTLTNLRPSNSGCNRNFNLEMLDFKKS